MARRTAAVDAPAAADLLEDLVAAAPTILGPRAFLAAAWPAGAATAKRLLERFGADVVLDADALQRPWPLAAGRYDVARWTTRRAASKMDIADGGFVDLAFDAGGGVRGAGRQPGLFKAGADAVDVSGRLLDSGALRVAWKDAKLDAMGQTCFALCHLAASETRGGAALDGVMLCRSPDPAFDSGALDVTADAPSVSAVFTLAPRGDGPTSLWAQLKADPAAAPLVDALRARSSLR